MRLTTLSAGKNMNWSSSRPSRSRNRNDVPATSGGAVKRVSVLFRPLICRVRVNIWRSRFLPRRSLSSMAICICAPLRLNTWLSMACCTMALGVGSAAAVPQSNDAAMTRTKSLRLSIFVFLSVPFRFT